MAQSSSFSSAMKWVGGIVGPAITAILIWYVTTQWKHPTPPPAPPSAPPSIVAGRVFDVGSDKLLPGVTVSLVAGTFSGEQTTDSEGRYGFQLESVEPTAMATLQIAAAGYTPNPYIARETLGQLSNSDGDEPLSASNVTPASGTPTNGGGAPPQAPGNRRIPIAAEHVVIANLHAAANNGHPAPATPAPATLPPYVRRVDLIKIGPGKK